MTAPSAPAFSFRPHVGLVTRDLEAAIRFYEVLLGAAPVKRRPGYAKFLGDDPPLNLSLREAPPTRPAGDEHFGLQVPDENAVAAAALRLRAAGLPVREEARTSCCYALQRKVWVVDPDGRPWEVFAVLGDSDVLVSEGCCDTGTGSARAGTEPAAASAAASTAPCCGEAPAASDAAAAAPAGGCCGGPERGP